MFLRKKRLVLYDENDKSIPEELLNRLKHVESISLMIEKIKQRIFLEYFIQISYILLTFYFLIKEKYILSLISISAFFLIIKSIKSKNILKKEYAESLIEEVKQLKKFKS